ncbi:MAG: chemotaxis protein CheW [Planctomycetota bacterium]
MAPVDTDNVSQAVSEQFIEFVVQGQHYAFSIHQIREIVTATDVTPLPSVPEYVDGVRNLRGTIIPIVNLRTLFGLQQRQADADTRTIVCCTEDRLMGCVVDAVTRVLRVEEDRIQSPPGTVNQAAARYLRGFVDVDDQLVIVLDVHQLLNLETLGEVSQHMIGTAAT